MNKNLLKYSLIALGLAGSNLLATDFHAPLPGGPLRYDFEQIGKNKSALNFWTTGYYREADKAFMKHGFDTHPFTQLIFGQESFTIADSFQDSSADAYYTTNQNPYLGIVKIAPRATYSERGITLGASWQYPIWKNKGRVGVRGSIPIRSVRVERDDQNDDAVNAAQQLIVNGDTSAIITPGTAINAKSFGPFNRYNLGLVSSLKMKTNTGNIESQVKLANAASACGINGAQYNQAYNPNSAGYVGIGAYAIPFVITPGGLGGLPPLHAPVGVTDDVLVGGNDIANNKEFGDATHQVRYGTGFATAATSNLVALNPAVLPVAGDTRGYVFSNVNDYRKLTREQLNTLWISPVFEGTTGARMGQDAEAPIASALSYFGSNVFDWLQINGNYMLQTYDLTGLGDADIDLFYNHSFTNSFIGEAYAGVRLPTGAGDKYYNNPFKMNLGNGDHFEIKVGANVAWEMTKCISMKADAHYNFVLNATEHRMAAYQGATVKNMGPKADADVDWSYFTGNLDVTLYHPKTKDIATTFGYEFYYKTQDNISFKQATDTTHWLGQRWTNAAGAPATSAAVAVAVAGTKYTTYGMTLSNSVARMNTQSIGHRGYVEGSYKFSEYLAISVGGKYTFAGQNIPCEGEAFTGFNVRF